MKKLICFAALFSLSIYLHACSSNQGVSTSKNKTVKTASVNNLTVTLLTADGLINHGDQAFTLSFTDSSGNPIEINAASVNFFMPQMGSMSAMNDAATLTKTDTPGVFHGKAKISMAGEWQVQIAYEGAAGKGKTSFPVTAQ